MIRRSPAGRVAVGVDQDSEDGAVHELDGGQIDHQGVSGAAARCLVELRAQPVAGGHVELTAERHHGVVGVVVGRQPRVGEHGQVVS